MLKDELDLLQVGVVVEPDKAEVRHDLAHSNFADLSVDVDLKLLKDADQIGVEALKQKVR